MANVQFPQTLSHKTFQFGSIVIDSNFDSGNCSHAQKVNASTFNIWIGTDHPKNNYRTWFYFSIKGFNKGITVTFQIKNMQNQSRLLYEGLQPVYRQQNSKDWNRITQKVNTASIQFYDGWIQWQFKHTMTSSAKVYFAIFYPWSNEQNSALLNQIAEKFSFRKQMYFHRTTIIYSFQGRPVEFLTISSKKGITNKQQKIDDSNLFQKHSKPKSFLNKKAIVIGARVHPGEVPGSHVMTGILKYLAQQNIITNKLFDQFVFYIFPIFNPDGVARGHYRADSNGTNLNRYYINPSPKYHSPIYAAKKFIVYLHENNRFFSFLDLHAHAARKGTFIYGNFANQLSKQVDACIFPKILSLNSENFQYEGSNFTQKNMYCKDKADQVSKEGSGRVAIYKATKNAYAWTLQCSYNCSRVLNILQPQKDVHEIPTPPTQTNLNKNILINYKYPTIKQPKEFFTIGTYHQLGKEICESFLDLIEAHPFSRIDNPNNHYKSVKNLKINLAIALLKMEPNRFQTNYKKIYYGLSNQNQEITQKSLKALYFLLIQKAKIQNINDYIKNKHDNVTLSPQKKPAKRAQSLKVKMQKYDRSTLSPQKNSIRISKPLKPVLTEMIRNASLKAQNQLDDDGVSVESGLQSPEKLNQFTQKQSIILENKLSINKVVLQIDDFRMMGVDNLRSSVNAKYFNKNQLKGQIINFKSRNNLRFKVNQQLPQVILGKSTTKPPPVNIISYSQQPLLKKGFSAKQPLFDP